MFLLKILKQKYMRQLLTYSKEWMPIAFILKIFEFKLRSLTFDLLVSTIWYIGERRNIWETGTLRDKTYHLLSIAVYEKKRWIFKAISFMIFLLCIVPSGILHFPKCNLSRVTYASDRAWACLHQLFGPLSLDFVSVYILLCQLVLRSTFSRPVPD